MSTYSPIASHTLSANATSVTFSGIPQGYTDLKIIFKGTATASVGVNMRFNGDTSTNYNRAFMYADGSGMASSRSIDQSSIDFTLLASRGHTIFDINGYSGSIKRKTVLISNDYYENAVVRTVGVWRNTSPITSISFSVASENIASGTVISLYGLAGGQVSAKASGGVITTSGAYTIHTFLQSGGFIPNENLTVDYLVVAGGGGGGFEYSGGGGAGGYRTSIGGTALSLTAGLTYPAIVGAGGTAPSGGPAYSVNSTSGSNSVFSTITSSGGGRAGSRTIAINASSGGSGGGGGNDGTGGAGNAGGYTPVEGYAGANSPSSSTGGGGGGASAAGSARNGGNGLSNSITGTSVTYAGGGGGGNGGGTGGFGGTGGGGNGGSGGSGSGVAGTANTGGGGGGAGEWTGPSLSGGNGGSGIVIVRYLT